MLCICLPLTLVLVTVAVDAHALAVPFASLPVSFILAAIGKPALAYKQQHNEPLLIVGSCKALHYVQFGSLLDPLIKQEHICDEQVWGPTNNRTHVMENTVCTVRGRGYGMCI